MIKATPDFAERAEIIESVPGLGGITSAGLIAAMPELGQVSNKVAAALLGTAPYDDDSGRRHGDRHIKGGRRKVRNLFYMACLGAATRHNPMLKAFYRSPDRQRQGAEGCARRLHAQADRHPQHHDRPRREMGRRPALPGARGDRAGPGVAARAREVTARKISPCASHALPLAFE